MSPRTWSVDPRPGSSGILLPPCPTHLAPRPWLPWSVSVRGHWGVGSPSVPSPAPSSSLPPGGGPKDGLPDRAVPPGPLTGAGAGTHPLLSRPPCASLWVSAGRHVATRTVASDPVGIRCTSAHLTRQLPPPPQDTGNTAECAHKLASPAGSWCMTRMSGERYFPGGWIPAS